MPTPAPKEHLIPAEIVSDRRDSWLKRVPIIALLLLLMYFLISDRVDTAQNVDSIKDLTTSQAHLLNTVKRDEGYVILASGYIQSQHRALREANRRLKAAGLKPVKIPPPPTPPKVTKKARQAVGGGASPRPSGHSHPSHHPHQSHGPSPPPPSQSPPPLKICTDLPVLGRQCVPPELLIGVRYVIIR